MKQLVIVAALVALLWPAKASASCSGFIDCLFGFTERTEVRNAAATEQARIQAQRDAETARIEAEAQERVRLADAEVERVKQLRFESEADRDIAIAQAEQQAEQYKAMIAGLTDEKIAGIDASAETQIAALQAQAEIAQAGILETGRTERTRIVGGWTFAGLVVVGIVLIVLYWFRRQGGNVVILLPDGTERPALPWYNEQLEIRGVQHEIIRKRQ